MDDFLQLWHVARKPACVAILLVLFLLQAWSYRRKSKQHGNLHQAAHHVNFISQSTISSSQTLDTKKLTTTLPPVTFGVPQGLPRNTSKTPKKISGQKTGPRRKQSIAASNQVSRIHLLVFFSSLSGTTERAAADLVESIKTTLPNTSVPIETQLLDISYIDYDDYFTALPKSSSSGSPDKYFYLILAPTYNIDTILNNFLEHLRETHHDFRVDTAPLSDILGYAVFGFGDRDGWPSEADGFCAQAAEIDQWMAKLTGRKRAYPLGMGDVKSDASARLSEWQQGVLRLLKDLAAGKTLGEGVPGSGNPMESDEEEEEEEEDESTQPSAQRRTPLQSQRQNRKASLDDLETIGNAMQSLNSHASSASFPVDFTSYTADAKSLPSQTTREMVPSSSSTHAALTKQGYTIIGSHSGVKICRWTKSALRGRGSCYKYSFYGIKSHLCMETTPSLSCSNKCVFCWRHGTNPVGTTWRWKVDPPDLILQGAKAGHYKKIKMMRGVPGVRAERFEEAMTIRHCALSLVGEPIFYPHINQFLGLLHGEKISSFLVCNAQHPDQLAALTPVTQLYVSIDASNRESLRRIDRPLHRDFWERFNKCLDIIREKRFHQRTVFRLTLVKGFNVDDEVDGYADLVAKGLPCFVEVKGVTFCGTSSSAGAGLTMQNVPFYEEVCAFVVALNAALQHRGLNYGIAAEHAHSCCILLASDRFLIEGQWHTVIDYERFFKCLESGREFAPEDYVAPTPEWALWGNGGFDPADTRVKLKGRNKVKADEIEL